MYPKDLNEIDSPAIRQRIEALPPASDGEAA